MIIRCFSLFAALLVLLPLTLVAQPSEGDLADSGYRVLKTYCHQCHGGATEEEPGLLVLDRDSLVRLPTGKKQPYVVPGDPKQSLLWIRAVKQADMPPEYATAKPTAKERQLIERWIAAGAPFPVNQQRKPVNVESVLTTIRNHLRSIRDTDRRFQRYFTLSHLYNNPTVTDQQLRLYRAAVSKLANSLSWQREIVLPNVLDPLGVVLHIDLRKLGWDESETWRALLQGYPYGVRNDEDPTLRELEQEIAELSKTPFAYLRGDWFVVSAARAPKYDTLLKLPQSLSELERNRLQVNLEQNFSNDNLVRGGFTSSKVSRHNRLVERHPTPFGAYWRSYDFASSAGKGNLTRFPLGPSFSGHPFPEHVFVHAGGEVIFNLPNGLQGYMLADAKNVRLDSPAPIEVVRDLRESAGSPQVVNGISCMSCHKHGMISFKDAIRDGTSLLGAPKRKVERLFPPKSEIDQLLTRDEQRFLNAVEQACGPYLRQGEDEQKDIRLFEEPIAEIARLYFKDLPLEVAAYELGLTDVEALKLNIGANPRLRDLGLAPLLQGEPIKRELWESPGLSLFHQVIAELRMTPNVPL